MNLFGLSPGELLLIMVIAMIVLGPEKLPETAASIGKWIREFRRVTTELTQQFTDENPFTEIQRALSLTDLTGPVIPSSTFTPALAPNPPESMSSDNSSLTSASTVFTPVSLSTGSRGLYFSHPAASVPIEDEWTHSGLNAGGERLGPRRQPIIETAIADDWAHGVAEFVPVPVVVDESSELSVVMDGEPEVTVDGESDVSERAEESSTVHEPADVLVQPVASTDTPFTDVDEIHPNGMIPGSVEHSKPESLAVAASSSVERSNS